MGIYAGSTFTGDLMLLQNGPQDFTFEHNTVFNSNSLLLFSHGPADGLATGLVFRNNIVRGAAYLIQGDATGFGVAALKAQAPGWVFDHNVVTGPWPTDKRVPPNSSVDPPEQLLPQFG